MKGTSKLIIGVVAVLAILFIVNIVYAGVPIDNGINWFLNQTSDWDLGTYVNTSSTTNEYNHTANLELSFPYADKDPSLVAYWRMESNNSAGVTLDETGYGRNGTLVNAVLNTTNGKFDNAYSFNMTTATSYMTVADNVILYSNRTGQITISLWYYAEPTTSTGYLFNKGSQDAAVGFLGFLRSSTSLYSQYANGSLQTITWSNALTNSAWNHLVWVADYNSTGNGSNITLYVNGISKGTTVTPNMTNFTNNLALSIADYKTYANNGAMGVYDEIKWYNRTLTATEISTLYNLGDKYINTTKTSPVATWTSARQNITAGQQLVNLTVNYSSFDQDHYIDRVEVLNYGGTSVANFTGGLAWNSTLLNDANLVSYYQLENNANDLKGINRGTVTGATSTSSGKFSNAYNFSGVTQSINVSDSNTLDLTNLTISAWVKTDSLGALRVIVSKGETTSSNSLSYGLSLSAGNMLYGTIGSGTAYKDLTGVTALSTNTWYHVAMTVNNTDMTIYLNGVSDKTSTKTVVPMNSANQLVIGGLYKTGTSYFWNGTIDDVAIFNRSLSAD